jgi:transcriptional regulator with XRE-family HTH domain
MPNEVVPMTPSWTKSFIDQLSDREFRHAYMVDQVRPYTALAIRILRAQEGRKWSQTELGERCGKPQSRISKLEDPDYGKVSLQTLFEIAEAFDLPLLVQFPDWSDWLRRMKNQSRQNFEKTGFDSKLLNRFAAMTAATCGPSAAKIFSISSYAPTAGGFVANSNAPSTASVG